jgi:hypothetical protein
MNVWEKYFRRQFLQVLTVGLSDVSLQWQTTTNTTTANHGRRWWKWPPSAPHEALHSAPMRQMEYGPQNTSMLWQCIIAITLECFEGHRHPQNLQKLYPLAWGVIAHPFNALAWSARPHVGH